MKKLLSFLAVLFLGVLTSACVNTFAVHELNQLAQEYIEKGDTQSAISRLESSVDLDDSIYESRYNLAVAYLKIDECEKAIKNAQAAAKLSPDEPVIYYTLGVANSCAANKYCAPKNPEHQTLIMSTIDKDKCEKYSKEAVDSYEKYLKFSPDAQDAEEVKGEIENHNMIINIPKS